MAGIILLAIFPGCCKEQAGSLNVAGPEEAGRLVFDRYSSAGYRDFSRNWERATFYTGVWTMWRATGDSAYYQALHRWAGIHGYRPGTEWFHPANRLAAGYLWLKLSETNPRQNHSNHVIDYVTRKKEKWSDPFEAGWDYVDALFVGLPALHTVTKLTGDSSCSTLAHKIFRTVTDSLFSLRDSLYYRDLKAKYNSPDGPFWSRGNGWVFASIPVIVSEMPRNDSLNNYYKEIFRMMAYRLKRLQQSDGSWPSGLGVQSEHPAPESSGTAFFVYGLCKGIGSGWLAREEFEPVVLKGWQALLSMTSANGTVGYAQPVARKPRKVKKCSTNDFTSGAFLMAAAAMTETGISADN
ncbi:MAG: hypothetical protein Kow00127_08790 [Bacteroidales bacterium]